MVPCLCFSSFDLECTTGKLSLRAGSRPHELSLGPTLTLRQRRDKGWHSGEGSTVAPKSICQRAVIIAVTDVIRVRSSAMVRYEPSFAIGAAYVLTSQLAGHPNLW